MARCSQWSWIVGGLILAAAIVGGAFISRGPHAHFPAASFQAQALGVAASIDVSL